MALFRRGLPRRATLGAFLGFLFSIYVLATGAFLTAVGWFLLSISLLFGRALSYYVYLTWAVLWIAWRGVEAFRGSIPLWTGAIEVLVPLVSVALLSASGYVEAVSEDASEA